ncbi:MAG: DUF370 domain-containing protein [Clostridia bacterium]|nr:DUF370 domain-containing protein [Clostridia bacterium]
MYLHIGSNKNIRKRHIIGIFDIDNATISRTTRQYLAKAETRGEVSAACEELPRAFVLYQENETNKICFSQLSSTALLGRCEE